MKKQQSLRLGAIVQTLPIVFGYGSIFLATPLIVAQLGLEAFGLWALTGALAQYGTLFDFGISRGVVRFVAHYHTLRDGAKERAVIGVAVSVVGTVGLALVSLALLAPRQLGGIIGIEDEPLAKTLFVASASILITGMLGVVFVGGSIGRGRAVAANIGLACQRVSVVLGGLVALLVTPSLTSFAYGSAIGGAVGLLCVLLAIFLDESEIRLGLPRKTVFRELFGFGIKGQILTVCDLVFSNSGKILLGLAAGPAAAGAYELGSRLALGARAFGTSTSTVLTAHLTRGMASGGITHIHSNYARLVQRNSAAGNFTLFLLASISLGLVPAWLGFENQDVVLVTIFLAASYTMNISTGVAMAVAVTLNRLGVLAATAIVATSLAVAIQLFLVHRVGLLGILIGVAIGSLVGSITGLIVIHRSVGIPMRDFLQPVSGPLLLGTLSTTIAISAASFFQTPTDRISAIPPLFLGGSIFVAIYLFFGWKRGYLPPLPSRLRSVRR